MFFPILVLLSALSISVIAAYYSIIGLTTIFSGAVVAVAIMGSALEVGKIVTATWLHHNWSVAPWLMKIYLTLAVLVLMLITSMGIFGYLSKSHITQGVPMSVVQSKIEQIDFTITQRESEILQEQKNIGAGQKILDQLDKSMELYFERGIISKALRERKKQQGERQNIQQQIETSNINIKNINAKISELTADKFSLQQEVKSFEVEVGPIKYIAELVYGKADATILDKSVRWIILTLIFVFDPLAILLILAANISFKQYNDKKNKPSVTAQSPLKNKKEETTPTNSQQRLSKDLEHQPSDKIEEESENFSPPLRPYEGLSDKGSSKNTYEKNSQNDNLENASNLNYQNWENEVETEPLYVDIPAQTSRTIKAKIKEEINQNLEELDNNKGLVKFDGQISLTKDIATDNKELQNRETKLAIPEKVAERHKLASQGALKNPTNISYKSLSPSKLQLDATIRNAFNKAYTSPQVPYNLESESGEFLKKLLIEELEKIYAEEDAKKEPSSS